MALHGAITGWGKYLPQKVLTNQDLAKMLNTSDEWIVTRTGIRERRILGDDETVSTMAAEAGSRALEVSGLSPSSLDLIIVATTSPDKLDLASACEVQDALGARKAAAFDILDGCNGFISALITAYQFIATGAYRSILVVGSEAISRVVNWKDRSTSVLFGDGAGAVVVEANEKATDMLSFVMGSDGAGVKVLYVPSPYDKLSEVPKDRRYYLVMDGREVYKFAVSAMADVSRKVVAAMGMDISDIDLFIPHQANSRIIQATARALGIPDEKVFVNVDRYGNISAASLPVALCEAAEEGRLREGDLVVLASAGAGLSWGAILLRWQAKL